MKSITTNISKIKSRVLVKDIMSTNVLTLTQEDNVYKAMQKMSKHRYSAIVIVKDKKPIGILTERDLLNRVFLQEKDPKKTKLKSVMTKDPVSVTPDTTVLKASNIMRNNRVRILLVIDDKIKGMISQTDIIRNMNIIYQEYKSLLWNPWFSLIILTLIVLLYLFNQWLFK